MDTVLLLGGRSFIGGHICRALIRRGYHVLLHSRVAGSFPNIPDLLAGTREIEPIVFPFDATDALRGALARTQFLVHAAIPYSMQSIGNPSGIGHELAELDNVLRLVAASGVRRSVYISVSGTIGRVPGGLADERHTIERGVLTGWGHLKRKLASEDLILSHARQGLSAVVLNPSMCVGAWDTKPSTGEFFRFIDAFPFALMPDQLLNIVDVEDVGDAVALALGRGTPGERYIISGTNTTMGALINRIRTLGGKPVPRIAMPRSVAVATAFCSELANLVLRRAKPLVPLLGIELIEQGSQHLSCEKARRELGYAPHDAWPAVDRAWRWYVENGVLPRRGMD